MPTSDVNLDSRFICRRCHRPRLRMVERLPEGCEQRAHYMRQPLCTDHHRPGSLNQETPMANVRAFAQAFTGDRPTTDATARLGETRAEAGVSTFQRRTQAVTVLHADGSGSLEFQRGDKTLRVEWNAEDETLTVMQVEAENKITNVVL